MSSSCHIIQVAISLLETNNVDLTLQHLKQSLNTLRSENQSSNSDSHLNMNKKRGRKEKTDKEGTEKKEKRVPSAYNLWLSDNMKAIPDIPYKERMGVLGGQWKILMQRRRIFIQVSVQTY